MHRERRTQRQHEIGPQRRTARPFEILLAQRLTEADRRRFERPAAGTGRRTSRLPEAFEMRSGVARLVTRLALDHEIGPVQLDEQLRRRAGAAMETIDVLRHHGQNLVRPLERDDRRVKRIGTGALINLPCLQLEVPVLDPRRLGRQELVVVHRTPSRPHAARSAKVRYPASSRHAGAGDDQDPSRLA